MGAAGGSHAAGGPERAHHCPRCGTSSTGRFCSECGASLADASCAACGGTLTPGARFCHRCGTQATGLTARAAAPAEGARGTHSPFAPHTPATPEGFEDEGAQPRREPLTLATALPWAVAAIALVALIALVAGQRVAAGRRATAADAASAPLAAAPDAGPPAGGPAPDISALSPQERAERLFDRVMRLSEERTRDSAAFAAAGKGDSLQFFAQMATAAYQSLPQTNADAHYDMGRIAIVMGVPRLAKTQADSILSSNPTHLLGLILTAEAARAMGDNATARTMDRRLLANADAEQRKDLPEYSMHRNDITIALTQARRDAPPDATR